MRIAKFIIVLIFLHLISNKALSQVTESKFERKWNWDNIRCEQFKLKKQKIDVGAKLPFSSVKVIDARFDTAVIGYYTVGNSSNDRIKLCLGENPQLTIEDFYNNSYQDLFDTAKKPLIIILKKLWINRLDDTTLNSMDKAVKNITGVSKGVFGVWLRADVVSENETGFHLLYSTDSLYWYKWSGAFNKRPKMIAQSLIDVSQKAIQNCAKINTLPVVDIHNSINSIKSIPILNATSPNIGVFQSFDEFKNNQPSVTNFLIRSRKISDEIFSVEKGDTILLKNVYAISDGKDVYLYHKNNFFKLHRNAFTFQVLAGTILKDNLATNDPIGDLLLGGNMGLVVGFGMDKILENVRTKKMIYNITQIDMNTGKLINDLSVGNIYEKE